MSDLDNLLDAKLDDLEDLPSFAPYPAGAHKVLASFGTKTINDTLRVMLDFKYIECLEMADSQAAIPKEGDVANTMFTLGNEFGEGNLKRCSAPFAEALQLETIRDVIEQVQDVECVIITGLRVDKNDKTKIYLDVKEIEIM